MGVELQHCAVYGYQLDGRFPWDKMYREDEYSKDFVNKLMTEYRDHDAEKGDFVLFQDPRADRYVIVGIVHFLTSSVRWDGPQEIPPTVMEEPEPAKVQAMEEIIDEELSDFVERKTEEPKHIVFTHNH